MANPTNLAGFTKKQIKNLRELAAYLIALPDDYNKFDMRHYVFQPTDSLLISEPSMARETLEQCGTIACAIGHGPSAGIGLDSLSSTDFSESFGWGAYTTKYFGVLIDSVEFDWMFSGNWEYIDNSPKGAGLRILWFLAKGVPNDAYLQVRGKAPLCYLGTDK